MTVCSQRPSNTSISVDIINYPGALQSAVYGFGEIFEIANGIATQENLTHHLISQIILPNPSQLTLKRKPDVIILPPALENGFYPEPTQPLIDWLKFQYTQGCLLCSVCSGAFILGATGLLDQKTATTHWGLLSACETQFPAIQWDVNHVLLRSEQLITAGGLMSWVDLSLELVAQFLHPSVMRQLGHHLVVDTGLREQRYYRSFKPYMGHGDSIILKLQHYLSTHYAEALSVQEMADYCHLTSRTFLRRFVKATRLKPNQYLQQLRIQKACEALECSSHKLDSIAHQVGYDDISGFRKLFYRYMGLTPREFRSRFGRS